VRYDRATDKREKRRLMKIHDFAGAPNPKKVRIYLAEKGIRIPFVNVDLVTGKNRTPEFLRKNPLGGVPVLELDDGSYLTESLAIIEFFEEQHPEPPMIGRTPLERARTRELERIAEIGVLSGVAGVFQNTHPMFAGRLKQSPDAAETARGRCMNALRVLNDRIANNPFVAGRQPTIADCTLLAALDFAAFANVEIPQEFGSVQRWAGEFRKRPSATA
jgi:glutathione S-transferase